MECTSPTATRRCIRAAYHGLCHRPQSPQMPSTILFGQPCSSIPAQSCSNDWHSAHISSPTSGCSGSSPSSSLNLFAMRDLSDLRSFRRPASRRSAALRSNTRSKALNAKGSARPAPRAQREHTTTTAATTTTNQPTTGEHYTHIHEQLCSDRRLQSPKLLSQTQTSLKRMQFGRAFPKRMRFSWITVSQTAFSCV